MTAKTMHQTTLAFLDFFLDFFLDCLLSFWSFLSVMAFSCPLSPDPASASLPADTQNNERNTKPNVARSTVPEGRVASWDMICAICTTTFDRNRRQAHSGAKSYRNSSVELCETANKLRPRSQRSQQSLQSQQSQHLIFGFWRFNINE
jgi:hypothetical protein